MSTEASQWRVTRQPGEIPCHSNRELFDHVGFNHRPSIDHTEILETCRNLCETCPLFAQCLRTAVTGPAVDGFIAGTLPQDRRRLQMLLNVSPRPVHIDALNGGSGGRRGQKVPHEVIEDVLSSHPQWTTQQVADHIGCAWHTVNRYLVVRERRVSVPLRDVDATEVTDAYQTLIASAA